MCSYTDNETSVIYDNIIVGNFDSIMLLGAESQNKLRDFSKTVSKILIDSKIDIDVSISQVINEIEQFQKQCGVNKNSKLSFSKRRQYEKLMKKYYNLIDYIDKATLYFQLQQAQLTKEVKMFEKLKSVIIQSSDELKKSIGNGKQILYQKPNSANKEQEEWFYRLKKRLEDLKISYNVLLQNQAQIKMLYNNNMVLIDKISTALSNTFPVWRNQVALLLGVELFENRLNVQDKILKITQDHITQSSKKIKKTNKLSSEDIRNLFELNKKLKTVLNDMNLAEENDLDIRETFKKILY
ncbi:MAG: toxic anion resistance protein [Eubacterium sp.]|nr:toxic anion resistance protein [Eubacterium sp.]